MIKNHRIYSVLLLCGMLSACQSTAPTQSATTPATAPLVASDSLRNTAVTPNSSSVNVQTNLTPSGEISLTQIMADPDWLGRQPEQAGWHVYRDEVVFSRKREGSPIRDQFAVVPDNIVINGKQVPAAQLHLYNYDEKVVSADKQLTAWIFEHNIFVHNKKDDAVSRVVHFAKTPSQLQFTQDGRLSFSVDNHFYVVDPLSRELTTLFTWHFAKAPQAVTPAADYIAQEQIKLIDYIANKRNARKAQAKYRQSIESANAFMSSPTFYFDPSHRLSAVSVSPDLKYAIIATRQNHPRRSDTDIMPHYIQENGRIASMPVRQRVADAKPVNDELYLLDLQQQSIHSLSYSTLPGYNDDVLADVKAENYAREGKTYEVNRLPRDITLFNSWYWTEPPIYWQPQSGQVGIMLEAWDNKDRWIATVDFEQHQLVSQHRLSDEAWINYAFNRFGWLPDQDTLYYLSEEDGYSHIYLKPIAGDAIQLTRGQFVVDDIVLAPDGQSLYYKANKKHPGIYEIYNAKIDGSADIMLTNLNGMTDYALSPSGEHLLLTHSTQTRPPELYLMSSVADNAPVAVTNTVSQEYLALGFAPSSIIEVPSSHVDQPIYSRLYMPAESGDNTPKRAVIFNHGAGYLQNSHMGWSGYFREYMFHNFLTQQGYVVLDMDYRASKGYGRDWRTAIYRQMGTPEIQDLRDGVEWLVDNANVDRNRIGTYGGSYGGFMTFMALFNEPDLFQAGAALRPVSDWAHYNTPYTSNILNTPDVDPIAYERSSPIYFAEGLQKPLLINAPMVDDNVFFVDVVRLVQRLIELEKENFETAIYPVEPHGFVQPSSWLDEYRRIYKLFEDNL